MLGFVVADPQNPATRPGAPTTTSTAPGRALDLDRRIMRLRERGGDAIVSFGGEVNNELAVTCTNQAALIAAYRSVINRYHSRTVDFDIEGSALSNTPPTSVVPARSRTMQDATRAPATGCVSG